MYLRRDRRRQLKQASVMLVALVLLMPKLELTQILFSADVAPEAASQQR